MENSPRRLARIHKMNRLLQRDAPWVFVYHPVTFGLSHQWLKNSKPSALGRGNLKYLRIDADQRTESRQAWNKPIVWPLWLCLGLLILGDDSGSCHNLETRKRNTVGIHDKCIFNTDYPKGWGMPRKNDYLYHTPNPLCHSYFDRREPHRLFSSFSWSTRLKPDGAEDPR